MSLSNCKRCGKLFDFQGHKVCQECLPKDTEDFAKIWEYLSKRPSAAVLELSRETGVEPAVINRFRREGRLVIDPKKGGDHFCAACGIPIHEGRFCSDCATQLRNEMLMANNELGSRAEVKMKGKVHTMDSIKKKRR
ncbi:MAG TPA: MerR family transcriptional regulator [Firmicutes bacterium]|nr:MerR family transcriptional regulator [Bacillota bacterium]